MDILVHPQDSQQAIQKMVQAGYEIVSEPAIPGKVVRSPEGTEVDILFGNALWAGEALKNTRQDAAGFPVLDLPYLVLMKIETAHTQDISDVARMLALASEHDLERVRAVVQRYAVDAVEDPESLIYLGKMELGGVS
ncbi:MAG: hypothetical protein HPY45_17290 [Anaerolineae bacterium]|nr:hypothetical protein [Anaerolineae bacterium]